MVQVRVKKTLTKCKYTFLYTYTYTNTNTYANTIAKINTKNTNTSIQKTTLWSMW